MSAPRVVIAGGGAAGIFAAITCAEAGTGASVTVLESTGDFLSKVAVSGGGRCNVTHACFDPEALVRNYPRGGRELLGPFHRFQPRDTVAFFEAHGVRLKTEDDGRMFPVTDSSRTIIDCLLRAARDSGVVLRPRCAVLEATRDPTDGTFRVWTESDKLECDRLLLAPGGARGGKAVALARSFGHTLEPPVPSLFTFHIQDARLRGLAGVASDVAVRVMDCPELQEQRGPLLVTHWGVSGPAILRLSAWGARLLHERRYQFTLLVNWAAGKEHRHVVQELQDARARHPKKQVSSWSPLGLPHRACGSAWSKQPPSPKAARGALFPKRNSRRSSASSPPPNTLSRAAAPTKRNSLPAAASPSKRSPSKPWKAASSPASILPANSSTSTASPAASISRLPGQPAGSPALPWPAPDHAPSPHERSHRL